MKTAIMQHKSKVIAHVDGLAASAASFLIMGAGEIEIVDGGFLMIHNALSFLDLYGYFNVTDLEKVKESIDKEIDLHGKINQAIANDYAKKTGKEAQDFLDYMNKETWFTAQEALDIGLVDRVYDGDPVENKYDLSIYNNVPEKMKFKNKVNSGDEKEINERDLEKDLRDAGYSRNRAKNIVAKVFRDERDARNEPDNPDVRDAQTDVGADQRDAGNEPQAKVVGTVDHVLEAQKLVDPVVELLSKTKQIIQKEQTV